MTRHTIEGCKFEDKIIKIGEDVASTKATVIALDKRINGTISDMEKHIDESSKWRLAIFISCIGFVGDIALRLLKW